MVMYFKSEKALEFLLKNGVVYTLRSKRKKIIGWDWIKTSRNGRKVADVFVEEVGRVTFPGCYGIAKERLPIKKRTVDYTDTSQIEPYVEYSGFSSAKEWLEEYWELVGDRIPFAWLYKVTLLEDGGYEQSGTN